MFNYICEHKKRFIVLGVLLVVLLVLLFNSFSIISPNQRGVKVTLGQVSDNVYQSGIVFKLPFVSKIKKYSVVPIEMSVIFGIKNDATVTKDMQSVGTEINLFYRYDENRLLEAEKEYNKKNIESTIRQALKASIKESVGRYSIYELIPNQDLISSEVLESVKQRVVDLPIYITQLSASNWDWNAEFDEQINQTMKASQLAKQATEEVKIAEQMAQKQVVEAEAKKETIRLEAEALVIKAENEAKAKKVEADALAYYNEKVAENYQVEIKLKELEIELERAKKWNGVEVSQYIPLTASGGIVTLPSK